MKVGFARLAGTQSVFAVQVCGRAPEEQVFGQRESSFAPQSTERFVDREVHGYRATADVFADHLR